MGTSKALLVTFAAFGKSDFCPWMDYMRVLQEQYSRRRKAKRCETGLRTKLLTTDARRARRKELLC